MVNALLVIHVVLKTENHMKSKFIIIFLALLSFNCLSDDKIKETFDKKCAICHGIDGKGLTKMGQKFEVRDYTDSSVQKQLKDDEMFNSIKNGYKIMKPTVTLTDDEIKELVKYIRNLKK